MGDARIVARPDLHRLSTLRDSLLDCEAVVDDERKLLLEVLERYHDALRQRDDITRQLEAAIAEAAR